MKSNLNSAIRFLLVEDDEDHADLIRRAILGATADVVIDSVGDGEEALAHLMQTKPHEGAKRPDVILLDINLPKLNGHQVLQKIKQSNALADIPVIMLTTSQSELDRDRALMNDADSFVSKPTNEEEFSQLIAHLSKYWATMGMA